MTATTGRLLDLWLPPERAGRALGCLATTFTFDADFFEQQCVGRFLGLDTRPGEAATDLGYLVEREEKLAETPVCVVADRGLSPDSRSLRWDVLAVTAPIGVMHAKVTVLVWEHAVRTIVSSANLTEHAFRRSIELAVAFDAHDASEVWRGVFDDLLGAVERVVRLAPDAPEGMGPRPRAIDILARARERIAEFGLPHQPRRGMPRIGIMMPDARGDALEGLMQVWSGGPPRWATVMSPYFDVAEAPSRSARRLTEVLAKRSAEVAFVVPVERDRQIARVPRGLLDAIPRRIEAEVYDVKQPDPAEPRGLHGKLILLESDSWIAALVGSSNFSAPGLGLEGAGNIEIGVAVGAPQGSTVGEALVKLALVGDAVDPGEVDLEPVADPEETQVAAPAGFVQALADPGPPPSIVLELNGARLPQDWRVETPDGIVLIDAARWHREGRPGDIRVDSPGDLPFTIAIKWRQDDGTTVTASLPLNVTDPGRLPPPAELRALPVAALLRALASIRPLHEAVVEAWERHERSLNRSIDELHPLKRFSPSGQLLHRTREMSAALAGLRERLERPAATLDAFRWRVEGPFGPTEVARKLIEDRRNNRAVEGEEAFMLAEIALTLAGTDVAQAGRFIPDRLPEMRTIVAEAIDGLQMLSDTVPRASALQGYVREAFARAAR